MKNISKYIVVGILIFACVAYLFSRCTWFSSIGNEAAKEEAANKKTAANVSAEVQEILDNMTLEEKIYQMFFVTPEQLTGVGEVIRAGETTKKAIEEKPVGGIVYFAKNIQNPEQISEMLEKTQEYSKISIFTAVDEEGGTVSRIGSNPDMGVEKIEPMAEVKDSERAYEVGVQIGETLFKLGFNVDFAPVADVLNGDNVIGSRSFGKDPSDVSEKVSSFVSGISKSNVCATLKHFPGQGSTTGDTHYNYVESSRTESEIRENELLPFENGIKSGAVFVMIGHMTVKALDDKNPATFSKNIVTNLLREEMGFDGIIITDAMNMGAILNTYSSGDAAVRAVKAGVDMILMPNDLNAAYEGLLKAVKNGEISESRIDESVARILKVKSEKGIL